MKFAMALFRYFPFGGLQRDFLRCAEIAVSRGHDVTVLLARQEAELPATLKVERLAVQARSNHAAMAEFAAAVREWHGTHPEHRLIGFNRIPGLDIYFAADSCFAAQLEEKHPLARLLPRYRLFLHLEQELMHDDRCQVLFLNALQRDQYLQHYSLASERYQVLPPGVRQDRRPGDNAAELRDGIRREFEVSPDGLLVLFLGSGFRVKGLDRALRALMSLPKAMQHHVTFVVAGDDDAAPFRSLARGFSGRIVWTGARADVPALLQGADLLLHPAYRESAGMVLAEALVAGLPVLTTDTCGYASLIADARSGIVVGSPFSQRALDAALENMLESDRRGWRVAAREYARHHDLFHMHDRVVDLMELPRTVS